MDFVYFVSKSIGINLNRIEWTSRCQVCTTLFDSMMSGNNFFITDADEISYFLNVLMGLEFDDEAETE